MAGAPDRHHVRPEEIRHRFNEGLYWQRADAGEFGQIISRDSHPSVEGSGEPFCTRSQIVAYVDATGEKVAVVHRYLRRDGSLGGSGRPDPKMLREGGVTYYVLRPKSNESAGRDG